MCACMHEFAETIPHITVGKPRVTLQSQNQNGVQIACEIFHIGT